MADRIAEQGALQDAISNNEINPPRLSLAGYIRGLFLDWSASPYNPLTRLTARGRYLGYFWDNGAIGLSMDFANQSFIVKDGTLQSKSFSDIVNFSRTSNATVTRADGTIGYAPHNLLTFSEQFDNAAWAKTACTITSNTIVAPNGTLTADKLTESTANNIHGVYSTTTGITNGAVYTYSAYVKAGESTSFGIVPSFSSGTGGAFFNLSLGTITSGTGTITPVGNGWYRCSANIIASATTLYVYISNGGVFTGDGTSGLFIWGAQLEIGSTATTYNPTTVKNLLGFTEAFDNAAWTKSNSFVQTNLLTYSEAFDNAAWTKTGASITANNTIAPNGYQTADKIVESALDERHRAISSVAVGAGNVTGSCYFKAGERNFGFLYLATDGDTKKYVMVINLTTGAITNTSSNGSPIIVSTNVTSVGNGWFRAEITATHASSTVFITAGTSNSATPTYVNVLPSYQGDGASGIYIWGAQLVQGSVAGDYRRTDAAALPVFYPNHNGVVCAEKLVENTANSSHYVGTASTITGQSGTIYTLSFYAKKGERDWAVVLPFFVANSATWFDLQNGIVGTKQSGVISASIIPAGNNWYRCSVTTLGTGFTSSPSIACTTSNNTFGHQGDGTSGIYIFGAQLSDSASLDPYVLNAGAAPSAAAYYGPRFDYDPVTLAPKGLLIEEQRSNLQRYSEFTSAQWDTNSQSTITNASGTAPDGANSLTLITETSGTSQHSVYSGALNIPTVVSGATYTASVYLKAGTRRYIQFSLGAFANSFGVVVDTTNWTIVGTGNSGTAVYTSSTISNVGNNFYRVTITGTIPSTTGYFGLSGTTSTSFSGSATSDGNKTWYCWGAQLEAGAFATSYIPTAASALSLIHI